MKRFAKSFTHALNGIRFALKAPNVQIQLVVGLITISLGIQLQISRLDSIAVLLCIGFVLSAEVSNSAVEEICNKFHPETHPQIALIKDLAAGSVLIAAITAVAIGILIFIPYLR